MGNSSKLLRSGILLFFVLLAVRSLVPTFFFEMPEFLPDFKVEKDSKGNVVYEKHTTGKKKGQVVKDANDQSVPVFERDKQGKCIVSSWTKDKKTGEQKPKLVQVPLRDKNGKIVKNGKKPVMTFARMTVAVWERCYLPGWYKKFFPYKQKIRLGLDLQGGTHLVLRVDVNKAIINKSSRLGEDIADYLLKEAKLITDKRKVYADPYRPRVEIVIKESDKANSMRNKIEEKWPNVKVTSGSKSGQYFARYRDEYVTQAKSAAVTQAMETIRNRVDSLGVSEPSISRYGETQIVIQLPGLKDPRRAKEIIGKTALLAFHVVEDDGNAAMSVFQQMDGDKKKPKGLQKVVTQYTRPDGRTPGTDRFFWHEKRKVLEGWIKSWNRKLSVGKNRKYRVYLGRYNRNSDGNTDKKAQPWRTFLLWRVASLTGEELEEARPQIDPDMNRPEVGLNFTRKGGVLFETMTGAHVGHRFAIVLEGLVDSAPVIQTRIGGGRARITLGDMKSFEESMQDAKDLSFVLKSGSLPAPVDILYEKTIGPGLGKDSIDRGVRSLLIGFLLVVFGIAVYYRASGLNANLALFLNILFVMSMMSSFGAVLTLPGLAGILLTIGMAVDANILIFERIREELRAGKTVRVAIQQGYDKAFVTILDANITTAIAGIVLYQYGSGPIRGFAVTLLIGILCSVFTALFVTRLMYNLILGNRNTQSLSI